MVVCVLTGVLFGPLDLVGQVYTPYPFANLFNSPAVWTVPAFFIGRWVANIGRAVLGAVVASVVAVEMYYVADVVFHDANAENLWSTVAAFWLALGLGAGVVFGTAGALSASAGPAISWIATAILPAVFFAEACHEATRSREADWIAVLAVVGVVILTGLLWGRDRYTVARTLVGVAAWTVLGFVAYLPFG